MNLGILLSPGDSLTKQIKSGQYQRFLEYYLKSYSKNFKKIYLFSYGDSCFNSKLPQNIKLIPKPKLIPYPLYQLLLPLIHHQKFQSIHVFRVFQTIGGLPMLLTQKPFIVTYGYDYYNFALIEKKFSKALFIKLLIPLVLNKATYIFYTSKENKNFLITKGYQKKIIYLPNGVDPNLFKPKGKKNKFHLLSVGRLTYQKNYSFLLEAVVKSKYRSRLRLEIIGSGPLKNSLIKKAHQLKINLNIKEPVSHNQLVKEYQKSGIFILTSKIEGQPKVLLEAMACGNACLTTSFSGNIIKPSQNGLIAHNSNKISAKLDVLLADESLRLKLGHQARQTIKKSYDIKQLIFKEIIQLKNA